MNLVIPGVGTESGPQYATDINNSLSIIDAHNHNPGSGVPITPSGININSALSMNGEILTQAGALILNAQASSPGLAAVYRNGVDLWYTDDNGNNIAITANGALAGTPGSIANLTSPASATYVSLNHTFVWQSNTSIAANLDAGSLLMRNISPNSTYALTLSPPASLSNNYTITLPTVPTGNSFLTMDTSGTISAFASYPLFSAGIASNAGILGTQLADHTITAQQITAGTITSNEIATNANIQATQLAGGLSATQMTMTDQQTGLLYSRTITATQSASVTNSNTTVTTLSSFSLTPQVQKGNRPLFFCFNGELHVSLTGGTGSDLLNQCVVQIIGTGGGATVVNQLDLRDMAVSIFRNPANGTGPVVIPASVLNCITAGFNLPTNHTTYIITVTLQTTSASCTFTLTFSNVTFSVLQV